MNKRLISFATVAVILSACAAPPPAAAPTSPAEATAPPVASADLPRVIFGLDWAFVGQHAPFFVALEKGFWKDEGLDVEIVRGFGSADAVQKVAAGAVNIAYGDTGSLVVARTENADVKLIGMVLGLPPHAVIFPSDKPIATPKDLEGKKIGAAAGDSVRRVFPAFAKLAGFDINKVEFITIGYEAYASQLLSGQIDGLAEYYAAKPNYDAAAAKNNMELGILKFSDHGLDIYSNGFMAKESYIKDNPEIIRKFLKGVYKGFAYAYEHEDEAVDALLKREPTLDRAVAKAQFLLDKDAVLTADVLANGYGHIELAKMQNTIDVIAEAYELKSKPKPEDMFTLDYLPSKADVPPTQ